MTKFVIVATQRSGSNFLRSIIQQHPKIVCHNEILIESLWDNELSPYRFFLDRINENPENIVFSKMQEGYQDYFTNIFTRPEGVEAVGFNIKYDQLPSHPELLANLGKQGVKAIHLVRENVFRTLLSVELRRTLGEEKARRNKKFFLNEELPHIQIKLPCDAFLLGALIGRNDDVLCHKKLLAKHFDYLEVSYESFSGGVEDSARTIPSEVLDNIYDFLGIKEKDYSFETSYVKSFPRRAEDYIENYDEVRRFLTAAGLEEYLETA